MRRGFNAEQNCVLYRVIFFLSEHRFILYLLDATSSLVIPELCPMHHLNKQVCHFYECISHPKTSRHDTWCIHVSYSGPSAHRQQSFPAIHNAIPGEDQTAMVDKQQYHTCLAVATVRIALVHRKCKTLLSIKSQTGSNSSSNSISRSRPPRSTRTFFFRP